MVARSTLKPVRSWSLLGRKSAASDRREETRSPRRRMRKSRLITAVDLGTTKVCVIIGEIDGDGMLTVLGVGSAPSRGIQRGMVTNINETVSSLRTAYSRALELARVEPREVLVGIAGDHIIGYNSFGVMGVSNPQAGIDVRDINNAKEKALDILRPKDMEVIHQFVQEYIVDGTRGITDPLRMYGKSLEVRMHVVTASVPAAGNIFKCIKLAGLKTSSIALQSLASSLAVLTPREREMGCILLDIGGGTTDIAIFQNGTLQNIAEIAMGGDIVTQDVAKMLRCTPNDAENLKKKLGHAVPGAVDADEFTELPATAPGQPRRRASRRELAEIIEARVEEIFFAVQHHITRSGLGDKVLSGVVLTGGTSMLDGIDQVAERILGYHCRVGRPEGMMGLSGVVSTPIYATAIGLIRWAIDEGVGYQREPWFVRKFKELFDIYA